MEAAGGGDDPDDDDDDDFDDRASQFSEEYELNEDVLCGETDELSPEDERVLNMFMGNRAEQPQVMTIANCFAIYENNDRGSDLERGTSFEKIHAQVSEGLFVARRRGPWPTLSWRRLRKSRKVSLQVMTQMRQRRRRLGDSQVSSFNSWTLSS